MVRIIMIRTIGYHVSNYNAPTIHVQGQSVIVTYKSPLSLKFKGVFDCLLLNEHTVGR